MDNYTLDDTQPKAPLQMPEPEGPPPPFIRPEDDDAPEGPGCAVWGCIGLAGVAFAVFIVLLAGYAGWTSGQREADSNATATRNAEITQQLGRVPSDLVSGNYQLADVRLRFLTTMTPGVPGVPELASTATQAYLLSLPTETPTPTPTPTSEPVEETAEPDDIVVTVGPGADYDLAALLDEARQLVDSGRFASAWELIDVIMAVDPAFEAQEVRVLATTALNGQARAMFNANNPAQGIIWAGRAEALGVLQGDLSFEVAAAVRWQNAQASLGLNYQQAINQLRELMDFVGPSGRYYGEAETLIYQQYVAYGDALAFDPNAGFCPAVEQYRNALNVQSGGPAVAKRDNAASMCAQATPTYTPTVEGMPEGSETPPAPETGA